MRIAVVGAGVSGLVSAYLLSRRHEVDLFERNAYFGGHSHTVNVLEEDREVGVDTGFIVYNEPAYPRFSRLLDELGVETQPSDMSFSVRCRACDLAYSSRGTRGFMAQPMSMLRPRNIALGLDILRFYRDAPSAMNDPRVGSMTLEQYLRSRRFSGSFRRHFIVPLAAAVWSMSPGEVDAFPAQYLLRFLYNHGLVGGDRERWRWRTVTGGSRRYVEAILSRLGERAVRGAPVLTVERTEDGVVLTLPGGAELEYDAAVLACHADEALAMLASPTPEEYEALSGFRYTSNSVTLHTDEAFLPREEAVRASWNYITDDCRSDASLGLTYHLNRLQFIDSATQYCATVNAKAPVREDAVIETLTYTHPHYSFRTLESQARLQALNGANRVYFAGAYLGHGFHEDGVESAYRVADLLGVEP